MEIDAADLLRPLLEGPAPSAVFVFTRRDDAGEKFARVRVKLLSLEENDAALRAAAAYAKEKGEEGPEFGAIYREAQAIEVCLRALCYEAIEEKDGIRKLRRLFVTAEQMRKALTPPEIAQVVNMYETVKTQFGPIEHITDENLDEWIAKLSDPMLGVHFLPRLDSQHWAVMLLSLAQQVQSLRSQCGLPRLTWGTTSESTLQTSDDATGDFTELPEAYSSESGKQLPRDVLMNSSQTSQALLAKLLRSGDEPADGGDDGEA